MSTNILAHMVCDGDQYVVVEEVEAVFDRHGGGCTVVTRGGREYHMPTMTATAFARACGHVRTRLLERDFLNGITAPAVERMQGGDGL